MSNARIHTLVVATKNRGKLSELRAMLEDMPVRILAIDEATKKAFDVVEDGGTFSANALKKARAAAQITACLTLADDSGLEVDVLGGAPGVRSARYAHERATDAENNAALLTALDGVAPAEMESERPKARFRCVLALVDPFGGEPDVVEGVCEGTITRAPRGSGGFGYDPMFVVAEDAEGRTMAELSDGEKNKISHRAKAWSKLRLVLERAIAARDEQVRRVLG